MLANSIITVFNTFYIKMVLWIVVTVLCIKYTHSACFSSPEFKDNFNQQLFVALNDNFSYTNEPMYNKVH